MGHGTLGLRLVSGTHMPVSPFLSPHQTQKCTDRLVFSLPVSLLPTRISVSPGLLWNCAVFFQTVFRHTSQNKHSTLASLKFSNSLTAKYDGRYWEREQSKNPSYAFLLPKFSLTSQAQHGCNQRVLGKTGHVIDSPAFQRSASETLLEGRCWVKALECDVRVKEADRELQRRYKSGQVVQEQRQGSEWCSSSKIRDFPSLPSMALQPQALG